ncbi:hypothetical protein ACL9RF_09525 [Sphingobacterium sp. Mn56C]|uniref:hypothetical protein n=1 Tax=Sphingobacterium sp. Mn56C TaxID=3395261 RepID=UPI003BDAEC37
MCRFSFLSLAVLLMLVGCNTPTKNNEQKQNTIAQDTLSVNDIQKVDSLTTVIKGFVKAYSSKDAKKVNSYVHPELGLTIIYRPGVADHFTKVSGIDFDKPVPENFPYPILTNSYALKYEKLPEYDCGTEKWDKFGFFCDTTSHPNQVSTIVAFQKEFNEQVVSAKELQDIEANEEHSYRVIITLSDPLVFHVQNFNGRWYITTLDRAYAGCDA